MNLQYSEGIELTALRDEISKKVSGKPSFQEGRGLGSAGLYRIES